MARPPGCALARRSARDEAALEFRRLIRRNRGARSRGRNAGSRCPNAGRSRRFRPGIRGTHRNAGTRLLHSVSVILHLGTRTSEGRSPLLEEPPVGFEPTTLA